MGNVRILFVCMGNICRSPTAEGMMRALVEQQNMTERIEVDSAGTHGYHVGNPPDMRAQKAAALRGVDLSGLRARRVAEEDFAAFDLILAMDRDNLNLLQQSCPKEHLGKLGLFLDYAADHKGQEVPDPYYGGGDGFDLVLDLVEQAASGLIATIQLGEFLPSASVLR
ncbi:MAG: low molecular weight protein-tyrosine-phosphatase [Rhodocyclaceae bacterium]|nr:low molecular weight protein-tyrosine-phosphatase [Rhodocyclaceae bacterium]